MKMRFILKSTSGSARGGLISDLSRLPGLEIETPHAFLYTQGGTIPHLSHEALQFLTTEKLGLSIPLQQISDWEGRLKASNFNLSEFIGMKEYLSFLTVVDPGQKRVQGFHKKNKITLWTKTGKKFFSTEQYMELVEELKPDIFITLCDSDTLPDSSKKRLEKAFVENMSQFDSCLDLYKKSKVLSKSKIFGALEGGFNLDHREKFSQLIGGNELISGVVVDGLHDCSEKVLETDSEQIKTAVEVSLKHIPSEKMRVIHGAWNPKVLLDLVDLGIDIFDTSYPFYITEQNGALTFPNQEEILEQSVVNNVNGISKNLTEDFSETGNELNEEPLTKKIKLITNSMYHTNMLNKKYKTDFSPILENCNCYTCKKHTRSYVHHLLSVGELLGNTLLTLHNLHHYFVFLSTIRKTIGCDKFQLFKSHFNKWTVKTNQETPPE